MNTTTTSGTVHAAIYVRISQDKTGERAGVERQQEECRALAERLGWTVNRVYCDNDISAYGGKRRPDYEAMLADIAAGKVGAVLAWHPDRLYRSLKDLEQLIDLADQHRTKLSTVNGGDLDLSNSSGRMVARILGSVARQESEHRGERVKAAWVQSAKRGKWHGGLRPYGYGPDGMTVVPDEAAEVAKMVNAIASGQSLRSVVRDLNTREVPTATGNGSRWQSKTVREMLMRPRIAGLASHHGKEVGTAQWPPLVDETVWRTAVSILSNPARATVDGARLGRGPAWLGSGIYRCGVCGDTLKVSTSSGSRKSYRCKNQDGRQHVPRRAVALDEWVEAVVVDYWSKPGRVEKMLAQDASIDTKALYRELAEINGEKDKLATAHGNGQIDLGQLITASKVFDDRAKAITNRLAAAGWRSPVEPFAHGEVSDMWAGLTLAQRRAILKVTAEITVEPLGRRPRADEGIGDGVTMRWIASRKRR